MVMKLQRAGATAPGATEAPRAVPAGWGGPKAVETAAPTTQPAAAPATEARAPAGWGKPGGAALTGGVQTQREEIQEKLNPAVEPVEQEETQTNGAFSADVVNLREALEGAGGHPEEPPFEGAQPLTTAAPKATRSRAGSASPQTAPGVTLEEIRVVVTDALDSRAGNAIGHTAPDAAHEARYAAESDGRQLTDLLHGAKAAAEAVSAMAVFNPEAAGEAYTMLFGAIEKRLETLGYADQ